MRLLRIHEDGQLSLTKNIVRDIPPYAILSHTWGDDEEEVTFQDLDQGHGNKKMGYGKLQRCAQEAAQAGLQYCWADTCCIDKTNNTELSEAINSMFNWYQNAEVCYAFLSDVGSLSDLDASRWFRRGWTLQELLAPKHVAFYTKEWKHIGSRSDLSPAIHRITGIPRITLLLDFSGQYSVAQVMSWAAGRETTREEDMAYCLLGLLGVNMPLLYGEGPRAFERLQQEFMRNSTDHSLFSWCGSGIGRGPFAKSPAEFKNCRDFKIESNRSLEFAMTNRGLRIDLPLIRQDDGSIVAVLNCRDRTGNHQALYLNKVAQDVYCRVRADRLCIIKQGTQLPVPQTIYIESPVPRTLGRDRLMPRRKGYTFRVDFKTLLQYGFRVERSFSPDDEDQWNIKLADRGVSVLTLDCSGQYGGLLLKNTQRGEQFSVVLGVHDHVPWLDISDVRGRETFENAVNEYYHYKRVCGGKQECKCKTPSKGVQSMDKTLSGGITISATINTQLERQLLAKFLMTKELETSE